MYRTERKKVGLALGGGYARGLAHIGVLEVFEREGIPIDYIAGTSIGALVGALYAREHDSSLLRKQAMQLDWIGMTSLVDLALARSGLVGGKRVTALLRRFMGDVDFKELAVPLSCIATDIITGDEVVIDRGSVLEAVRASISIPVIFTVVKRDGRYLVDGGLVNQVPVSAAKKMGADIIIAVDITPSRSERADYLVNSAQVKEPSLLNVVIQTIYITTYLSTRQATEGADVVIHPHLAHIAPAEFHRSQECILEGEYATVDKLSEIKKILSEQGVPTGK
ncbi:MAG: patatin-like phospholipase family protein [Dehalococcoidales bacterium]|nr:patatin-like phospholipase family protein [Dehalococcoidales bacterium]